MTDSITTLHCSRRDLFATKRFRRNGNSIETTSYNAGTVFFQRQYPALNIQSLSRFLTELEGCQTTFVIRGDLKEGLNPEGRHRRRKDNFNTPPRGHCWIMLDFDKLRIPSRLSLNDPVKLCDWIISILPAEFQNTSYHYQLSSSAGMGDTDVVSMHIWFWLTNPVPDKLIRQWALGINRSVGYKLIDHAPFNDVQPHYTAAPIFENLPNPFPVRSGLVEKKFNAVKLQLKEHPRKAAPTQAAALRGKHIDRQAASVTALPPRTKGFAEILNQIGDHDGGEGFHIPVIRAIASYVATHGTGGTDVEELYDVVSARVIAADSSNHSAEEVEQRASREHIIPAIEGAIKKYGDGADQRQKSRLITGMQPHFKAAKMPLTEAQRRMRNLLSRGT